MAANESLVFASTEWNDGTNFDMEFFDPGIAPKRFRWIAGADSDGALSPEEAHYDNAEATARIRVLQQADMDTALSKLGTLVEALQECEKQPLGEDAVWTPATSTKSLTMYVLGGEVTGLPINPEEGWFQKSPVVTLRLIRRPFLYGAEVTSAATATNTDPYQILTIASVAGDVDAEARLVITDAATQSRRHVEWGLEQRYYNAATSLIVESDNLVTSGFAGTQTTRSGAYDVGGGNTVVRGTLTTTPVAICGTGNLSHVGTFRVKARVYANPTSDSTADDFKVRLSWKEGDGPLSSNDYTSPVVTAGWSEIDLGTITIPEKALGTQRWTGQVEAYSEDAGDTLDVDYLFLIPAGEGYGKGRAPFTFQTPTAFTARDEFNQAAGNLNAKTLGDGVNTWATSGAATDLAVEATGHTVQRSTTGDAASGRTALASLAASTTQGARIDFKSTAIRSTSSVLILRHDGAGFDYLTFSVVNGVSLYVERYNGGIPVASALGGASLDLDSDAWYTLAAVATAAGDWAAWLFPQGGIPGAPIAVGHDTDIATGGDVDSGQMGFRDINTSGTAATRSYDNFATWVPTIDAAVFSGRSAEIRHDRAERADSTGTYYGPISAYRGDRFYVPPDGSAGRTSRIFVKARRNDIDVAADDQIADSTTATVHLTPRYYLAPR